MIREDGWEHLRLVFLTEDVEDVRREFEEQGVGILCATGSLRLRKRWHKRAARLVSFVGGQWVARKAYASVLTFLERRSLLTAAPRCAAVGGAGIVAGVATVALQYGLERALPSAFMTEYTVVMKKSDHGKHEIVRVKDGAATRELVESSLWTRLTSSRTGAPETFGGRPLMRSCVTWMPATPW